MAQQAKRWVQERPSQLDPDSQLFRDGIDIINEYDPTDLAAKAGVHFTTVYSWLSGKTKSPRLVTFIKVLRATGHELAIKKVGNATVSHLRRVK